MGSRNGARVGRVEVQGAIRMYDYAPGVVIYVHAWTWLLYKLCIGFC